jgi:cell division protease FtsH
MDVLHRLSNALLEREILDSEEIDKLMRGEELPPLPVVNGSDAESGNAQPAAVASAVHSADASITVTASDKSIRPSRSKKPQA